MKVAGTAQAPFSLERTYQLLQDPAVLQRAIPGCQSLECTGDAEYKLKLKVILASLSGAFEGQVRLTEPQAPTSFRMVVEGSGKIGFVKGDGLLTLTPTEDGTEIAYDGDAQIGGNIASVGQRMIDTTARLLIKRFFKKLAAEGSRESELPESPAVEDQDVDGQ
jgi:carbon monoxide dehydrogenase subunit G